MPKVMCPVCDVVFRSRTELTEHKAKTGHTGGAVIYVEPPKKEMVSNWKIKTKKSNKKPNTCPRCYKGFKNKKALENHQRDKKHYDSKKITGQSLVVVDKKTPAHKVVEEVPIITIGKGYVVIRDSDYNNIMTNLDTLRPLVNFETIEFYLLPSTNSWMVSYDLINESDWDYILFYCDFVEIEHTLESLISLQSKLNLDNKPKIFDMASLTYRTGVSNDIYQTNECLFISHKEDESVSFSELILAATQLINSADNALSNYDLLLVGSNWEIPPPPPIPASVKTESRERDGAGWIQFNDDYDFGLSMFVAETQTPSAADTSSEEVVEEIETLKTNPVYLITDEILAIDKLVNVELVKNQS